MAKLSEEALEEGRNLIRAKDLDGFITWLDQYNILIDRSVVRSMYDKIFKADDIQKALAMFNAVFPVLDPVADICSGLTKLGFKLLIVLGAIGGLVYLVKLILF